MSTSKVCLFVDNNALHRVLGGRKVDFKLLRNWLAGDREAVLSYFYCGETNKVSGTSRQKFYLSLEGSGFEVKTCKNPISRAIVPEHDADIDASICCQIAWDMSELSVTGYYDCFVVLSGSFALAKAAKKIRKKGIEIEAVYDNDLCSPTLKGATNRFRQISFDKINLRSRGP